LLLSMFFLSDISLHSIICSNKEINKCEPTKPVAPVTISCVR
jgi:hypothetical protein